MEAQAQELEAFLRGAIAHANEARPHKWDRSYSSPAEYDASVAPQREMWKRSLYGELPFTHTQSECVFEKWLQEDGVRIHRLSREVWPGLTAQGLLLMPEHPTVALPLVVCVHGMLSSPENVAGVVDPTGIYHRYGLRLAQRGYAVLAPKNVSGVPPRARLHRLATLFGTTLVGLEIRKIQVLLEGVSRLPSVDASRLGMYGISQGGLTTLYMTPLEPRIRCAVVTAYFNKRTPKMITSTDKSLSFLDSDEEDKFIPGLLQRFSDADLASLVCPRPLLIEAGRNDRSIYWPEVLEEYEIAREHYVRLGIADRIEIDLHAGGHEIHADASFDFLDRWLGEAPTGTSQPEVGFE